MGRVENTHDFIDDTLVRVEVEREAGVAAALGQRAGSRNTVDGCTDYFSMSTRDALFVVFVRTRPYITRRSAAAQQSTQA